MPDGRVLIAPDDGPLTAAPTYTRLDDADNFCSGFDFQSGRQTLLSRTDTGEATVYFNDTQGRLDPNNTLSDLYGKVVGKQILLQVWNPVISAWKEQWQGTVNDINFDIDPATNPDGSLVVANVQLECVDVFDYLAGYGLTPGLDGVTPPSGSEGTIWYAQTAGNIDDRIIEVLTDVGIDSTRYVVFTFNVSGQAVNYDADESALVVLRDCVDAELPFIGNAYVDRIGRFCAHGRGSRFDPDAVSAGASAGAWPFQRWKVGDGAAILADSDRAQMRVLSFTDGRSNIVNAAICYPKGIAEADIPGQVYADATSITAYGKHAADPLSDLVIQAGTTTGNDAATECLKYAELLVKNQKDPRPTVTSLMLKSIWPDDSRAAETWGVLTEADISDIVNLCSGYPGGVGIGQPDGEDYFIEGRRGSVRPLNSEYDYVELELNVSPAVWSQDPHGVFA